MRSGANKIKNKVKEKFEVKYMMLLTSIVECCILNFLSTLHTYTRAFFSPGIYTPEADCKFKTHVKQTAYARKVIAARARVCIFKSVHDEKIEKKRERRSERTGVYIRERKRENSKRRCTDGCWLFNIRAAHGYSSETHFTNITQKWERGKERAAGTHARARERETKRVIFTLLVACTLYISLGALIYSTRMNITPAKVRDGEEERDRERVRERAEKREWKKREEASERERRLTCVHWLKHCAYLAGFMKSAAFIVLRRRALCFVRERERASARQLRNYSPGL